MRWAYPTNNSHWRDAELPDWIPEVADASSGWLVGNPYLGITSCLPVFQTRAPTFRPTPRCSIGRASEKALASSTRATIERALDSLLASA